MAARPNNSVAERLSAESLYRAIAHGDSMASEAVSFIGLRHCYHDLAEFDQRTGESLPRPMSSVYSNLRQLLQSCSQQFYKDRLHRILDHCREPLDALVRQLVQRLLRERAMLPLRSVRELDTSSFASLSRRPGRTMREKLAGKPYMLAIRRRCTYDSTENRLLKVLVERIVELLMLRTEAFGDGEDPGNTEILELLQYWLVSDAADEIGLWNNPPPNNALLQHRGYRRLWDAWLWAQSLDQDLHRDWLNRSQHYAILLFWAVVTRLADRGVRFLEQPCYFDYDDFRICPGLTVNDALASAEGLWLPPKQNVKTRGVVHRITDKPFGFAITGDGRRVFFHASDFEDPSAFRDLKEGSLIWFSMESTDKGWSARQVVVGQESNTVKVDLARNLRLRLCLPNHDHPLTADFVAAPGGQIDIILHKKCFSCVVGLKGLLEVADYLVNSVGSNRVLSALDILQQIRHEPQPACRHAVVDITTLRPRYADAHGNGVVPVRLLWQLWQQPEHCPVEIALMECSGICLDTHAKTISILNLIGLGADGSAEYATQSQAAKVFASYLKAFLGTDSLSYLVPDSADDFSLEALRKSLNFQFAFSEPLPRSIAAVFEWQSSDAFAKTTIRPGDCVWILDTSGSCLCITPLIAAYNAELANRVPESRGIYWERCPAILGGADLADVEVAIRILHKCGCPSPQEIGRLVGLQGLLDEGDDLSFLDSAGRWFTAPSNLHEIWESIHCENPERWHMFAERLAKHSHELGERVTLHLLPVGDQRLKDTLGDPPPSLIGRRKAVWRPQCKEPARGGIVLHHWQARAGDLPLWRDHLPELSFRILKDGRYALFHVVKDATINPKRGRPVTIPIEETFILPAGHDFYQFPLFQGTEGNELQYEAFLRSPAFPLPQDSACRLNMTFTYGADDPYELVFVPIESDSVAFRSVRTQWQPRSALTAADVSCPPFPRRLSWSDLRAFPVGAKSPRNLVEEIEHWLSVTSVLKSFDDLTKVRKRAFSERSWGWMKTDWKDGGFCFVETKVGDVFCHVDSFCEKTTTSAPRMGAKLFFDLSRDNKGRWRAENVSFTKSEPSGLGVAREQDSVRRVLDEGSKVEYAFRSVRSAMLTAWSHGHNLSEKDAPDSLRQRVQKATTQSMQLMALASTIEADDPVRSTFYKLADSAFYFLCSLGSDAPEQVYLTIAAMKPDDVLRHWRRIALAIGDADQERQRALFHKCLQQAATGQRVWMQILGIAVWRAANLVHEISAELVEKICMEMTIVLEQDLGRTIREDHERGAKYISPYMTSTLELCLGLLRTREAKDDEVRSVLAPGKRLANRLAKAIEKIEEEICASDVPFRCRIVLNLDKPETLRTPDLFYALRLFLTGDSGARAIQVTGVEDDE